MKKVLILHPEGNVNNNPTLHAFISSLKKYGISCDITVDRYKLNNIASEESGFIYINHFFRKLKKGLIDYVGSVGLLRAFLFVKCLFYKKKYDLVIGVDREGLVEAWVISRMTKLPYLFFSFEIIFAKETSEKYKKIEKKASKNISLCLTQDELRSQKLMDENGISGDKIICVPVAGKGLPKICNGRRVRDVLGIPEKNKVVVFMGSISRWTKFDDIVKEIISWPDEWVLLVHSRYGKTQSVVENIIDMNCMPKNKIFMTKKSYDTNDDLGLLLKGVDCGLALYEPDYNYKLTGLNLKYLGMSSGKITTFLRYGVSVIINELDIWKDIVVEEGIGKVVKDSKDIAGALRGLSDMGDCSEKCKLFFENKLSYGIYERDLIDRIKDCFANS